MKEKIKRPPVRILYMELTVSLSHGRNDVWSGSSGGSGNVECIRVIAITETILSLLHNTIVLLGGEGQEGKHTDSTLIIVRNLHRSEVKDDIFVCVYIYAVLIYVTRQLGKAGC